jgi:methyl farnesoate epoxidase/farnesoate epoxidase
MAKKWLGEYGPIVGLMFGSQPTVAVIGAEAVLEVLRREEFQGRPDNFNARFRAYNKRLGKSRLFLTLILP